MVYSIYHYYNNFFERFNIVLTKNLWRNEILFRPLQQEINN